MNDKELLELAAKASDYGLTYKRQISNETHEWVSDDGLFWQWNPLIDDGQALRLAVKCRIDVEVFNDTTLSWVMIGCGYFEIEEKHNDDQYAATRRAIVRAAAEIGKAIP